MGMAASQLRYCFLQNRFNDNLFRLTQLTNQKTTLTREMKNLSSEYNEAKNKKVLKWYNNGNNYIDITYDRLMTPSTINSAAPNMVTDLSGRIVINSGLKRYAEMISPDGKPVDDWESKRSQVLSAITGVPAERIDAYSEAMCNTCNSVDDLNDAVENLAAVEMRKPVKSGSLGQLLAAANVSASGFMYGFMPSIAKDVIADHIVSALSKVVENPEALEGVKDTFKSYLYGIPYDTGYSMDAIIGILMGMYKSAAGISSDTFTWINKDSSEYQNWESEYNQALAEYNSANEAYNNASAFENEYFTGEVEQKIAFYDNLFSAVAERGWVYNSSVDDSNYLNEMLQNNMYTLTTNNRTTEFNQRLGEFEYENDFTTNIASNMKNVVAVNDDDYERFAMEEYTEAKQDINNKESLIDNQMAKIQTEQSAIQTRMQALQKIIQGSIERTMNITG
jgi:chaperonin cofactor prefoldin